MLRTEPAGASRRDQAERTDGIGGLRYPLPMFEHAEAAVEAALGAGARYADARVMDRRHESMDARNGEIEGLTQEALVGLGVRALIGSGWGFFSTADLSTDAARAAGARAAAIGSVRRFVSSVPCHRLYRY